jgi:tetratricopeptide (TPR) repeat protein
VVALFAALLLTASAFAQVDSSYAGAALYRSGACAESLAGLESGKAPPRAAVPLARCYMETGAYRKAADALLKYRAGAPDDAVAVVLLSQALEKSGNESEAAKVLDDLVKRHPENVALHNALGDFYAHTGNPARAASEYEMVTKAIPNDPAAHTGLGELALIEQRWADATPEFDKALSASPANRRALTGLGTAYVKLGSCNRAESPLRQALDLGATNFPLAKMLSVCLAAAQKWKDVLGALRTGTLEEAMDEDATALVTKAFAATKNPAEQEAYYKKVLALAPANITAHTDYADLLAAATPKRTEEARDQYLEVVKLRPDSPRIQERLGDIYDAANQPAEARKHYEAAVSSASSPESARIKLARLCYVQKDLSCAKDAASGIKSAELMPERQFIEVRIEYQQDHLPEARKLAEELLSKNPKNLELLRIAADVAERQDRVADAAQLYDRAVEVDPGSKDLRYPLVKLYMNYPELEGVDKSITLLSEYLAKYEQDAEAYLLLGNAYRKKDDVSNARQNFQTGIDRLKPPIPERLAWAYTTYGGLLFTEKEYELAYRVLTDALRLKPKDEAALLNYGLTCIETDRKDQLEDTRTKLEALNSPKLADLEKAIKNRQAKRR